MTMNLGRHSLLTNCYPSLPNLSKIDHYLILMNKFLVLLVSIHMLISCSPAISQTSVAAEKKEAPPAYDLVYAQDFESPQALHDFELSYPSAWKISDAGVSGKALDLFGESKYEARVRSPFNIALIKNIEVGDFILELDLSQTGKEYGHRDLCLFFNVESPTNYYYVHIASVADDRANNIFIVNDEPRIKIGTKTTAGTDWGATNSWHKVRIERKVESGTIAIFFDDMSEPIMEATDVHFTRGRIGVGSFDDTGRYDNIKIWAPKVLSPKRGFFDK